jgi:uncharacterized protein involved in exopolysaccharide biosynthesis
MINPPAKFPASEEQSAPGNPTGPAGPPVGALRVVEVLARERRILWRYPLAVTVIVVLISFLFPNEYRSTVSILPPERDFQSMSVPIGDLKSLAAGGMSLPLMATPSDILAAVLTSRTVRDSVVSRLGLDRRWGFDFDVAVGRVRDNSGVKVAQTGVVEFWVVDRNRYFSDTLVNSLVDEADRLNQSILTTKARRTREFVESRLVETRAQLDVASRALREFQSRHRSVALEAQISALVGNAAKLKGQLTADEIDLSALEGTLSPEHYRIKQLRTRIRETKRQIEDMESSVMGDSAKTGTTGIAGLPRIGQEMAEKLREVKIAETLYTLLTEQYENARIQERRDTPSFSVLDRATRGGQKIRPKRLLIGIGTLVVAFVLAAALVLVQEYLSQLAMADPAKHRAVLAIRDALLSRRSVRRG